MKYILFCFIFSFNLFASDIIICGHKEVCSLLNQLLAENNISSIKTETLASIIGDPHEFEPSSNDIKKAIQAKILINGQKELNPWLEKASKERSRDKNKITFFYELPNHLQKKYKTNNLEALSHFWLYPHIYCDFKEQLSMFLKDKNIIKNKEITKCDTKIEDQFLEVIRKLNRPIILTHDALEPFFKIFPNSNVIALKNSGHHHETDAKSIKNLYQSLKKYPKAIWIIEKNIELSQNVDQLIRKDDLVIQLNTEENTSLNSNFQVLAFILSSLQREK